MKSCQDIEIYNSLVRKINEIIGELLRYETVVSEQVVEQNECLQYLLNEGLKEEVINEINQLVADGTMDNIINVNAFGLLNEKIDRLKYKIINVLDIGMDNTGNNGELNSEKINSIVGQLTNSRLYFPNGTYLLNEKIFIEGQKNFTIECEEGAILKVAKDTKISEIVGIRACENFKIINLTIDGNNNKGMNGLGFRGNSETEKSHDGFINNLTVKNLFRAPKSTETEYSGGGRALTFQMGVANIIADNIKVTNCTTAIDVHGILGEESTPSSTVNGIVINNVIAEECEEVVSGYSLSSTNIDLDNTSIVSMKVNNIFAHNCGKSTQTLINTQAENDGTDGGIFVFERARGITIDNATIINDSSYGKIGGLLRGTGKLINISNVFCDINCVALINNTSARNLLPLTPHTNAQSKNINMTNIKQIGSSDFVLIHNCNNNSYLLTSKFTNIEVGIVNTQILNNQAGGNTTSYLDVRINSTNEKVSGLLKNIYSSNVIPQGDGKYQETITDLTVFKKGLTLSAKNGTYPLIIERTGTSNPGKAQLSVYGQNLSVSNSNSEAVAKFDLLNRNVIIGNGTWDGGHLVMRNRHIWVDSTGKLRLKNGAPTSDTDGIEITTQGS